MTQRTWFTLLLPLMWTAQLCNLSGEPFTLGSRTAEIPESGKVTYTILRTGKNEVSFLPPSGWKSEVDAKGGTITWTSTDYQSSIRLKITDGGGDQAPKLRAEDLRETVAQEISGAKINEEFPCFTSGASGLALDCEHVAKGQFAMASRVALVPIPGGLTQFNLTSPKDQFTKRQIDFTRFLNSFRIENGKSQ
jgi:hypothetical protein